MAHLVQAMLDAGFPVTHVAGARRTLVGLVGEGVLSAAAADAWAVTADQLLAGVGGEIAFQVRVLTSTTEHLVDVLAVTPVDAALAACQIVSRHPFGFTPTHAEVITDSTLTAF